MAGYIITPWKRHEDLLEVRSQLYRLGEEDDRKHAVGRVLMWKMKGHLPHAVESTALLVDAFLAHEIPQNSEATVRSAFSAAFTRFVTGFCDIGRNRERSLEPSSMLDIARQIDMPEGFVTLRHEATHEETPSMYRLVPACEEALQWLWKVYWSRIDLRQDRSGARNITNGNVAGVDECLNTVRRAFKDYRGAKREALKKLKTTSTPELDSRVAETIEYAIDSHTVSPVAEDIVAKDWLLPSDRKLGKALDGAYLLWDGLLRKLAEEVEDFRSALVTACLDVLTDRQSTVLRQEAYALWTEHLICSPDWQALDNDNLEQTRRDAIKFCLLNPGRWTNAVAKAVVAVADKSFQEEWTPLLHTSEYEDGVNVDLGATAEDEPMRDFEMESQLPSWYLAPVSPKAPIGMLEHDFRESSL